MLSQKFTKINVQIIIKSINMLSRGLRLGVVAHSGVYVPHIFFYQEFAKKKIIRSSALYTSFAKQTKNI